MSAAAGVLGQCSAAAGAVEFLFTFESVQRNNENLQVTMDGTVRMLRQTAPLCDKSQFCGWSIFQFIFLNGRSESCSCGIFFDFSSKTH
ncbi:hypothetical protein [Arthrobacter sp. AFG20]|uniref:hypothetical protein n=1 Tax=Arthrobacter sp. AFG20 TaxID=1688671 RepID=UPI0011AFCDEF|nr:hypothetical protein [Arthrobacter sp. AFG20]